MDIPTFPAGTPAAKVNAAFDEAGCVVVTGLLEDDTRTAIRSDLAPHMAAARIIEDDDPEEFYPGRTRRVTALIARSPKLTDSLIAHPVTRDVCDAFLLPNSEFG